MDICAQGQAQGNSRIYYGLASMAALAQLVCADCAYIYYCLFCVRLVTLWVMECAGINAPC